ncbi:helix-turn-helix domain-containing protein [Clostridium sp. BL-8]|uniref:helix-turn-helix domain-containing protein n=1 Tax=Clostridium sp. BL-8 TaxID=349938 RepID=UPI00098CC0B7|nr:helix-turn-helix domain-containing protein [Clostridium sp. BL-8]OOM80720.1 hypothetical protein CLOBL_07530 [Clostridium sp. BL-8]
MSITIITSENRRLCPATIYNVEDKEQKNPIYDIDDIYDLMYKKQNILVISTQFDQYGKELKIFNGELGKSDIRALFVAKDIKASNELDCVMTLSEAAKKWGLANGSTIRKAIERGKFEQNEIKQAGDVWITTYSAMERVFGSIKNEENAYVIYDDFETLYLTKAYWEYAELSYYSEPNINAKAKDLEIKYQYIKDVFIKGLKTLRDNQKIIIKKSRNNKIRQVICSEDEYFLYIEAFRSRRNLSPEWIDRLINDLKSTTE